MLYSGLCLRILDVNIFFADDCSVKTLFDYHYFHHVDTKASKDSNYPFTFNQSLGCLLVFSNVEGSHEEKQSTQNPDKWTDQETVLQTAEAPLRVCRFRIAYSIRNLMVHNISFQLYTHTLKKNK